MPEKTRGSGLYPRGKGAAKAMFRTVTSLGAQIFIILRKW